MTVVAVQSNRLAAGYGDQRRASTSKSSSHPDPRHPTSERGSSSLRVTPPPASNENTTNPASHVPSGGSTSMPESQSNLASPSGTTLADEADAADKSSPRSGLGVRPSTASSPLPKPTASSSDRLNSQGSGRHLDQRARRTKPPFLRSKSDFPVGHDDFEDQEGDEIQEWGARHGFEDHYQSDDIISQLANVRFLILFLFFTLSVSLAPSLSLTFVLEPERHLDFATPIHLLTLTIFCSRIGTCTSQISAMRLREILNRPIPFRIGGCATD